MLKLMRWSVVPAAALGLALSAAPAEAQQQATVVMKSGERHTGNNPRHRPDKGEFALRKSLAEEFRVPGDTVAYVDFGGAPDVNPDLSGSQWGVVMKNGTVHKGQLIEMGHGEPNDFSTPFLVIFRDAQGQEHRWTSNEVGRVYFPGGAAAAHPGTSSTPGTSGTGLVISSKQQWTPTGITVRKGERISFNATGEIQIGANADDVAGPAGAKSPRYAPNSPLPRELAGALIGRIGNGPPFGIGNLSAVTMPSTGQLFIGVNDDNLADNSGEFRVEILRGTNRRR